MQLNDDLGVEVEPVGVLLEGDLLESGYRVGAVSRMELGEIGAERSVLEARQDPVPDELVERHTPLAGSALDHGARAEHGIGLFRQERSQDLRERLWRILAVAVEHDHDVEPVLDGQVVPRLLIPAVAQVRRLPDQGDRQVGLLLVARDPPDRSSPGCDRR